MNQNPNKPMNQKPMCLPKTKSLPASVETKQIPVETKEKLIMDKKSKVRPTIFGDSEEQILQETIQKGNKFYVIEQTPDESREVYLDRVNYVINKLEESDIDKNIEQIIALSLIWRNIKFYKMTYPSTIMRLFRDT
jgi:hypothetical protein